MVQGMHNAWYASEVTKRFFMKSEAVVNRFKSREKPELQTFQLRIVDLRTSQIKVSLNLPVGLVAVAQRQGARLLPPDHTMAQLLAVARAGKKTLQWVDLENNERFELTFE
jgi:hypothetical protein